MIPTSVLAGKAIAQDPVDYLSLGESYRARLLVVGRHLICFHTEMKKAKVFGAYGRHLSDEFED